jgi:predicted DCC family thiol-disulfide oxidoreductase YuxK
MEKILFFDGVCVMCNSLVSFVMRHDKKKIFYFATLQGKKAHELIPSLNDDLKTVVLWDNGRIRTESDAIIDLLIMLGGIFKFIYILKIFPKAFRDKVYRFIANHRYQWFGQTESCALLSPEEQKRILE